MNGRNKAALDRYFLRVLPSYQRDRNAFYRNASFSAGGLLLSCVDFLTIPLLSRDFAWFDVIAVIVFFGSAYYLAMGWFGRNRLLDELAPESGHHYYTLSFPPKLGVATLQKDAELDHDRLMSVERNRILGIHPNARARAANFVQVFPGFGCNEVAHRSEIVDDWICSNPFASIKFAGLECRLPDLDRSQMQLLYSKVSGPSITTDDEKLGLVSDIVVGLPEVLIIKRTYFDSIATNEAFRTTLFQKPERAAYAGYEVSSFSDVKDLPEEDIGPTLYDLSSARAANHIGASVFALSDDRYPIFFEQGIDQEEGAGTVVVSGTGSADWMDRNPLREETNFFDIPKRSMMREFMEEAGLWTASERVKEMLRVQNTRDQVIGEMAKDVMLVGYFRWVSRFGKPEFLGVTKTDVKLAHVQAQAEEVVKLRGGLGLQRQINNITELADYLDSAKAKLENSNVGMSLSSAMLLNRLLEICSGNDVSIKLEVARTLKIGPQ